MIPQMRFAALILAAVQPLGADAQQRPAFKLTIANMISGPEVSSGGGKQ